ncbi:MAG: glycosyltransferase [Desulfobacterales bacterium]|nr:glycosyltransferase [Desulfobacterales bacterium]
MPVVLWWGRSDPHYSRNRIVRGLFSDLGWKIEAFHPLASPAGLAQAYLGRLKRPDLVWVPCFRQRDISSAAHWARKWQVPLVVDPLISAYEKEVFERRKWPPGQRTAEKRRLREAGLLSKAQVVVVDTPAHGNFFSQTLNVAAERIGVLYVGAESGLFEPVPAAALQPPYEILFYGSFLQLQGVDVIVKAAQLLKDHPVTWVLLGDGDLRGQAEKLSAGCENISYEPWIDYRKLPDRIHRAHILLGIFGTTLKADLVIPNKVFQAMAAGRPLITRRSSAYGNSLEGSDVIGWVTPGDAVSLSARVRKWIAAPSELAARGQETRKLYDQFFSHDLLRGMLQNILDKAFKQI